MKKNILKIVSIFVILILILNTNIILAANGANTSTLESEKKQNEKKQEEAQSNLKEVQAQKSEAVKQVEAISSKIDTYENQIEELENKITDLNTKISSAEKEIKEKEASYNQNEKLLQERLVAAYEAGDTSYLDVMLSSENLTDLISNYYLVSELATYDAELLEKIQKEKEEIQKTKESLETNKKSVTTTKTEKEKVSTQLQQSKKEKAASVEKLSKDEKEIQAEIDELKSANVQIAKDIKKAQEEYAKQIAALNNNKNNNSNNNNNTNSSGGNYTGGGNGTLQRPVKSGSITATMYYSNGSYHGALDYGIPVGTPIYAAATGVVIKTANLTSSYGTYVVLQHANGLQTWYAHGTSGSILVSPGQTVSRGQQIMSSGNSGHSFGPHLHFEVRVAPYNYNTCRVDPRNYM
jgi:murein DD-endopeptidase MepM/ murein hydrolase activator NlpD